MLVFIIVPAIFSFVTAWGIQGRRAKVDREQLDWFMRREQVDVGDITPHCEIKRLRRRISGLLASPSMYLRARRMYAPLDIDGDDLMAELELYELAS